MIFTLPVRMKEQPQRVLSLWWEICLPGGAHGFYMDRKHWGINLISLLLDYLIGLNMPRLSFISRHVTLPNI